MMKSKYVGVGLAGTDLYNYFCPKVNFKKVKHSCQQKKKITPVIIVALTAVFGAALAATC